MPLLPLPPPPPPPILSFSVSAVRAFFIMLSLFLCSMAVLSIVAVIAGAESEGGGGYVGGWRTYLNRQDGRGMRMETIANTL